MIEPVNYESIEILLPSVWVRYEPELHALELGLDVDSMVRLQELLQVAVAEIIEKGMNALAIVAFTF